MNSPFDQLHYDETYLPDEATMSSARFLAGYGYPIDYGVELILSNVLSIRKVSNREDVLDVNDAVLHLVYECWVRSNNCWLHPDAFWRNQKVSSANFGSPDIVYLFKTGVLIQKSILLQEEIILPQGFADWIAAEDVSDEESGGVAISAGLVPEAVVEEYLAQLKSDWHDVADSYFEADEPSLDTLDPKIRVVIERALQRYSNV
jgi:hypothetical protein